MPRIRLLPETLANQIAAGEVVERPAAVVKELVENALDAGATRVDIDLLDGGRKLVRVRDDGCGMGREDAALSLSRHATSKLQSKEDLFSIATYGFRGEALPSIAAVSRFALLTCERGALAGTRIEVEGGQVLSTGEAGAPPGTTVEVRDLFFNVPARKKFLKRASTEQAHALEAVLRLALPRPEASLTLREGEKVLLRLPAGASLEERAVEALGAEARGRFLSFEAAVRGVRARGLAASPDLALGSGRSIWLFVNGRGVRDRQLMHAVLRAYGEVIPHGRYPAALVFLDVPPAEVDVNVHPAKAEVRLADPRAAYEAIARGIGAVLAPGAWLHLDAETARAASSAAAPHAEDLVRIAADGALRYPVSAAGAAEHAARAAEPWPGTAGALSPPRSGAAPAPPAPAAARPLIPPQPYFGGLRYLGQLHRTYLVCEGARGLVLVDQHAAHERINYQRLRRAARDSVRVQPLLLPRIVQLPAASLSLLSEAGEPLARAGIEIEAFGPGSAAVKALPAPLGALDGRALAALLADLAEEVSAHGGSPSLDRLRDALLARAACHGSVRAHDALAPGEAQALLDALDGTDFGARCAHGRPVVAEWNAAEIEKRFGRDYQSHSHAAPAETL